ATIVTNVPVSLQLEQADFRTYDRGHLLAAFHDLGFKTLLDRVPDALGGGTGTERVRSGGQMTMFASANGATPAEGPGPDAGAGRQGLVADAAALEALLAELRGAGRLAFNVQATGLEPMRSELVGLGLATDDRPAVYVP